MVLENGLMLETKLKETTQAMWMLCGVGQRQLRGGVTQRCLMCSATSLALAMVVRNKDVSHAVQDTVLDHRRLILSVV